MGLFQKKNQSAATETDAAAALQEQVETVRAIIRRYKAGTRLSFGAPTRCPHCGDYGFVQGVNRGEGLSYNHCFGCQADWVISVEALRIVAAEPMVDTGFFQAQVEEAPRPTKPSWTPPEVVVPGSPSSTVETATVETATVETEAVESGPAPMAAPPPSSPPPVAGAPAATSVPDRTGELEDAAAPPATSWAMTELRKPRNLDKIARAGKERASGRAERPADRTPPPASSWATDASPPAADAPTPPKRSASWATGGPPQRERSIAPDPKAPPSADDIGPDPAERFAQRKAAGGGSFAKPRPPTDPAAPPPSATSAPATAAPTPDETETAMPRRTPAAPPAGPPKRSLFAAASEPPVDATADVAAPSDPPPDRLADPPAEAAGPSLHEPTTAEPTDEPTADQPTGEPTAEPATEVTPSTATSAPAAAAAAPAPAPAPAPDAPVDAEAPSSSPPAPAAGSGVPDVLRVIVVEDNPFDVAMLEELVEQLDPPTIELLTAQTLAEGARLALTTEHHVIMLDLGLPDSDGIATLLELQHQDVTRAPVIIMSGTVDADTIREARALGAAHYIKKDQLAELADMGVAGSVRLNRLLRTTIKHANALDGGA